MWQVQLNRTWVEAPRTCLVSSLCLPCAAYEQRARVLGFTGEQYRAFPGCWHWPGAANPPSVWPPVRYDEPAVMRWWQPHLLAETMLCLPCAIGGTRSIMQRRFNIKDHRSDIFCLICPVSKQPSDTASGHTAVQTAARTQSARLIALSLTV